MTTSQPNVHQPIIMVVDDNPDNLNVVADLLSTNYSIRAVPSGYRALELLEQNSLPDLILLDVMMPKMDGFSLAKEIRLTNKEVPIIFLTAKSMKEDTIQGFKVGADDYITKPFDLEVLQARVRVQMRTLPPTTPSQANSQGSVFECDELKVDKAKVRVTVAEEEIALTSTEFKILTILAEKPGHVFTRTQLISNIQGENIHVTGRTIDTHIAGLRKKLASAGRLIETIRGIGYRFKDGAA